MSWQLGAIPRDGGVRFAVRSRDATAMALCLFRGGGEERLPMARDGDLFVLDVEGARPGDLYGYRADGPWQPDAGHWFDPDKLLVDPYAQELDRPFVHNPRLARPRGAAGDTAPLVPKARVPAIVDPVPPLPPLFQPGGLIYEVNVRALTMRHPDIPPALRGTIAALAHPAIVAHLRMLGVTAIELMPIVAWIDERHLPPLGLRNAWGYNPVVPMALDPRLAPGGLAELRATVAALRDAGIGVILDLVFNHSGESDVAGPTLALRGLGNRLYYAADAQGRLINDSGCGNTLACWRPEVRALVLDSLRHFVAGAGVDGFRFDLAPVLARGPQGFDPAAPIFAEIGADPLLADRVMIAEPWDIGPGGYQLGKFPAGWLEWNDRYRDDVRRFWRGDAATLGALATRLAGSSDVFGAPTRSVNFLAAHDGFTLADTVAYAARHNHANGEANRDGHGENFSWNCGVEGPSDDPAVVGRRNDAVRAMLATLFGSVGTIMLTAGDEFGRSQAGNNNAYAQDNDLTWLDWENRDRALEAHVALLSALRRFHAGLFARLPGVAAWETLDGKPMLPHLWNAANAGSVRLRLGDGDRSVNISVDRAGMAARISAA